MILFFYSVFLFCFSIYSYALIDPNLTMINHSLWVQFRDMMVVLGYNQRELSSLIYIVLVIFLFLFHYYFVNNYKKISLTKILLLTSSILFLSYPFLSHDFFNYLFDARIATFYHQNPYFHKALDYPTDQWLRFMHWTHRNYPYGPTWLLITLVPSIFTFGKFILNFILFKAMFIFFYIVAVYYLNKMNKKWAIFFATNPLVLVEGLTSPHNDLVGISLAIIGIYYLSKKRSVLSRIILFISGGVKYITLPLVLLLGKKNTGVQNRLSLLGVVGLLLYLSITVEIQPWYFLALFGFLPYYDTFVFNINVFFAGLLLSYYPYVRLGGWDSAEKVAMKHLIIVVFFIINTIFLLFKKRKILLSR